MPEVERSWAGRWDRYSDYRKVGELLIPFRLEYLSSGVKTGENVLQTMEVNTGLTREVFEPRRFVKGAEREERASSHHPRRGITANEGSGPTGGYFGYYAMKGVMMKTNVDASERSTRRHFLASFSSMGLSTTLFPGVLWARWQDSPQEQIDIDMMKKAASLAGLEFTDEELELMLDEANKNFERYQAIRRTHLDNSDVPLFISTRSCPASRWNDALGRSAPVPWGS